MEATKKDRGKYWICTWWQKQGCPNDLASVDWDAVRVDVDRQVGRPSEAKITRVTGQLEKTLTAVEAHWQIFVQTDRRTRPDVVWKLLRGDVSKSIQNWGGEVNTVNVKKCHKAEPGIKYCTKEETSVAGTRFDWPRARGALLDTEASVNFVSLIDDESDGSQSSRSIASLRSLSRGEPGTEPQEERLAGTTNPGYQKSSILEEENEWLQSAMAMAKSTSLGSEFMERFPLMTARHFQLLSKYQCELKTERCVMNSVELVVLWGEGGTGKSRMHRHFYGSVPGLCYQCMPPIKAGPQGFFDGYKGQKVVIIEEISRVRRWNLELFKTLTDPYQLPFRVETKGGTTTWEPTLIIICTNSSPMSWYGAEFDQSDPDCPERGAFMRRVPPKKCWHFTKKELTERDKANMRSVDPYYGENNLFYPPIQSTGNTYNLHPFSWEPGRGLFSPVDPAFIGFDVELGDFRRESEADIYTDE